MKFFFPIVLLPPKNQSQECSKTLPGYQESPRNTCSAQEHRLPCAHAVGSRKLITGSVPIQQIDPTGNANNDHRPRQWSSHV